MARLAILGASGHGSVIADAAALDPKWSDISFFDDAWPAEDYLMRWPIIGNTEMLISSLDKFSGVIIGIGNNIIRETKHKLLSLHSAPFTIIVHPSAYVSPYAQIGLGTVIFSQASININASLGLSCIVNNNASVDHDCFLSDFVHVSPGSNIAGSVQVAQRSWIGIGSSIREGVKVGSSVVIGAGATVIKDVPNKQVVVGNPAAQLVEKLYK